MLMVTAEPLTVPLKPPALRGAPSDPALRLSTNRFSKQGLTRKSESNLRSFATAPASALNSLLDTSPRRAVYNDLLDSTPGVIRHGEGFASSALFSPPVKPVAKTSSMASLRRAFLGEPKERRIVDLSAEVQKRDSMPMRPVTPGAASLFGQGKVEHGKVKGLFGRLKEKMGGKNKLEKLDEAL